MGAWFTIHEVSHQTIANVLKGHDIEPGPSAGER